MTETIKVYFAWKSLQPDRRQWKPSMPTFEPSDVFVVVGVPGTVEYVYNLDEIQKAEKDGYIEKYIDPILTLKGMRYCIDQFEKNMMDIEPEKENSDDEEWETTTDDKEDEEWE